MKKKLLALLVTASLLCGCAAESEPSMNFVDVGDIANIELPAIQPIYFGENESSGDPSSPNIAAGNSGELPPGSSGSGTSADGSSAESPAPSQSGNSANASQSGGKTAEIVIPAATEYNVCIADFSVLDPEKVKTALLGNVDITPEIYEFTNREYPSYEWNIGSTSLHVNNNSSYVDLTGDLSALIEYITFLPTHNSDGNIEDFKHRNDDLDFCTREQAVKSVKETLAKMDINVSEKADVYAFHQIDLQDVINERIKDERFYDPRSSVKDPTAKPLTSYTVEKSQECYYIVFREEYDNVPIYNLHLGYRTIKDLTIFHPSITAVYSSEGLVGFSSSEYRGDITKTEKVTQVISPESAAQAVAAKYADVVGIKQVDFDKIELMYVITPNYIDGKINILKAKMIPAWVCTVSYTQYTLDKWTREYGDLPFKETVLIDAQTGAEII